MSLAPHSSTSITDRMMRAARLDVSLYEEVEADTNATSQALTVVVVASVAAGLGSLIGALIFGDDTNPILGLIGGIVSALVGWAIWSFIIFFVGTRLFGGVATYGEVLRTLGFAYTPQILTFFGFIPFVGWLISLAAAIWGLVTGFVGARQALDLDNGKTIATIIVAFIAYIVILAIIGGIFGLAAFGAGALGAP